MNSRLHFKISTSSFQMKLCCLCTRARRGFRLHRPFHAATGALFSPKPLTPPPTARPRFTQQSAYSTKTPSTPPSPRSTPEPFPAPACSTWPCARSSASTLSSLLFPTRDYTCLAVFICSPAALDHIDPVPLASPAGFAQKPISYCSPSR